MNPLLGHVLLLVVFSFALGGVVSGYREDEKTAILRGTLRRALRFALAVIAIAAVVFGLSLWLS